MNTDIKSSIRSFLADSFKNYELKDDEDIFALGFVNSLFAMQLVLFVENTFNIVVENDDLELDNFRTIDAITNLVTQKQGAVVAAAD